MIEHAEILAVFPEFARFQHRVPFLTPQQQLALIGRMARNAMRLTTGCIVWGAHCNNDGYGRTNFWIFGASRSVYVHRLALRMSLGRDLRHWEESSHKCDVPPCFNPEHLFAERIKFNRIRSAKNTQRKRERRAQHERMGAFTSTLRAAA